MSDAKQHAHELIDRLPETQLSALVELLEAFVDPVGAALRDAPVDDEPETEEEERAVAEAREWLKKNGGKGISHEEAMGTGCFLLNRARQQAEGFEDRRALPQTSNTWL